MDSLSEIEFLDSDIDVMNQMIVLMMIMIRTQTKDEMLETLTQMQSDINRIIIDTSALH